MRSSMLAIVLAAAALCGCVTAPEGFDSPEPGKRMQAIAKAARDEDKSAIPKLIRFLNSDDPAVRMASIRTLDILTDGTTTPEYDYAAPEWQRKDQVAAWVAWYNQQHPQDPIGKPIRKGAEGTPAPKGSEPGPGNADTVSASGS